MEADRVLLRATTIGSLGGERRLRGYFECPRCGVRTACKPGKEVCRDCAQAWKTMR